MEMQMNLSNHKKVFIDGVEMKELSVNGVRIWKGGYTNLVPLSTEADGTTIYNNGLGYKDGYRVRSSGAETTSEIASCTGYIPVKGEDIIRLSGYNVALAHVGNAINVFDGALNNLGQVVANRANSGYGIFEKTAYASYCWNSIVENPTGVYTWIVPPDTSIAYMRVTGYTGSVGSKMIVTINEEIA
jgi:hypothetical protein